MESKRIFNQAKMNRDIDDRLLPEGSYRYANNVNIGESEGGDIGAVENLKGNHPVGTIDDENSTTIGVIRDPNNDRVYWFTKGDEFDAIYEYDDTTREVVPILKDSVSRDLVKPTCVPTFTTFINEPDGDDNNRPAPSFKYSDPVEGCMDSTATNYNPSATYTETTVCEFQPAGCNDPDANNYIAGSDGSVTCTYDSVGALAARINGVNPYTTAEVNGTDVTLTATGLDVLGTASFEWDTGETTDEITVNGTDEEITGSVTVTDSGRTAPHELPATATATYSVTFQAGAPVNYTWQLATTDNTAAGITASGADGPFQTTDGIEYNIPLSAISMAAIDDTATNNWDVLPTASLDAASLAAGITISAVNGTSGTTPAANVSLGGSFTPTGPLTSIVTWAGGTLMEIQMGVAVNYESTNFHVSSVPGTGTLNVFNRSGTTASIFGELIQLNEFGLISGAGNILNVNFTVTPFVESGGNVTQTIDTGGIFIPANDQIHNVNYQWQVDAAIDTTWNIIINTVEISLGGVVTGTTGLITGSPSPALTRSGSGGSTP